MSEFDDLARSPLDDSSRFSWRPVLLGAIVGLTLTGMVLAISSSDTATAGTTTAPRTSATTLPPEARRFPPGYTAVSEKAAFKPHHITTTSTELVVGMTSAHARDSDPPRDHFIGGQWALDMASGESLITAITRFDDSIPGSFAVVFPPVAAGDVEHLRLTERWLPSDSSVTFTVPVDGALTAIGLGPFEEPIGGLTLRIIRLMIPNIEEGSVLWQLDGAALPRGAVAISIEMLDAEGSLVAMASSPPEQARGLDATEGMSPFAVLPADGRPLGSATEQQDFMSVMNTVRTLVVTASVTTGSPEPIEEVVFDLTPYATAPLEEMIGN